MSNVSRTTTDQRPYVDDERTCLGKVASGIRALSIGKYNHGLYFKGESHQSSLLGGLATTVCALVLLTYMVLVFRDIVDCAEYSMDESVLSLDDEAAEIKGLTVKTFLGDALMIDSLQLYLLKESGYKNCSDITVNV